MKRIKLILVIFLFSTFTGLTADSKSPGVFDNKIIFGQSAAFKGASASLGSELWRGAQAYFNYINSTGGVHNRKIEIKSLNDNYDGDLTILNTIKLIREENVFALFGYVGTPTIVKALPAIQKFSSEGVVLFSNFTGAQPQREMPHSKYVFNVRSSYRQETAGIVDNLVGVGIKKIGIFIQFDAYGRSGADGVERALAKHGLKIIRETTYKRGSKYTESMMAQVDILKKYDVEAVISVGSYEACAAFIRDSRKSGFNGPIANVSFVGADSLLKLLKGTEEKDKISLTYKLINSQVVPPWGDTSIELVKEYQEIMNKFDSKIPANLVDPNYRPSKYSFVSLEGFLNAKILVNILKQSPKNITRENFVKKIESLKNLKVGLEKPISFTKENHQASDEVYFTTIVDGQYQTITNWEKFK